MSKLTDNDECTYGSQYYGQQLKNVPTKYFAFCRNKIIDNMFNFALIEYQFVIQRPIIPNRRGCFLRFFM